MLSNSYGPYAYATSFLLIESVINVILMVAFSGVIYVLAGLRSNHFGVMLIVVVLFSSAATSFFSFLTSITSSSSMCNDIIAPVYVWNSMYAGYLIFIPNLGVACNWVPYIAAFRYALQGLVLNEFQDNDELPTGQYYIEMMGYDTISVQACVGILLVVYVLSTVLYFISLKHFDNCYR